MTPVTASLLNFLRQTMLSSLVGPDIARTLRKSCCPSGRAGGLVPRCQWATCGPARRPAPVALEGPGPGARASRGTCRRDAGVGASASMSPSESASGRPGRPRERCPLARRAQTRGLSRGPGNGPGRRRRTGSAASVTRRTSRDLRFHWQPAWAAGTSEPRRRCQGLQ